MVHIWTYMVIYGHIWSYMAIYGHIYGHTWPYTAIYMAIYSHIYGHIWPYMAGVFFGGTLRGFSDCLSILAVQPLPPWKCRYKYAIWQAMGAYIQILAPYYLLFAGHMWPCIGYTLSYVFDTKYWKIWQAVR